MKDSKLNQDFHQFQSSSSESLRPSEKIQDSVLGYVKKELQPSHRIVFSKLLAIHAFIGTITLTFCPQFSLSLTHNHQLYHYFHHTFGKSICMIICGTIFVGSGAIFAAYLLKKHEVRLIKDTKWLYYLCISMLGVVSFMIFGADIYLHLIPFWFLGASISGVFLFDFNYKFRQMFFSY